MKFKSGFGNCLIESNLVESCSDIAKAGNLRPLGSNAALNGSDFF